MQCPFYHFMHACGIRPAGMVAHEPPQPCESSAGKAQRKKENRGSNKKSKTNSPAHSNVPSGTSTTNLGKGHHVLQKSQHGDHVLWQVGQLGVGPLQMCAHKLPRHGNKLVSVGAVELLQQRHHATHKRRAIQGVRLNQSEKEKGARH